MGRWEVGAPHTCKPKSPQSPPCSPSLKAAWRGALRSGQEGEEQKEIILCSLAHSHIKSNSFIFTFIHPSKAGEGLLGRRGLAEGLLRQGAGGSLGEVRWGRSLCQRIPYLILRAPAQEFSLLIRAGQRVAAAVTTHVECGVHGVGEVGGLVRVQGKVSIQ